MVVSSANPPNALSVATKAPGDTRGGAGGSKANTIYVAPTATSYPALSLMYLILSIFLSRLLPSLKYTFHILVLTIHISD